MSDKPIIIETGENPSAAVIWLHGLGADGYDFAPIVPQLKLPESPAIRFVFPHAPEQRVTLNQGMFMRAWYDILGLDRNSKQDVDGLAAAQEILKDLIAEQIAQGIPAHKIILVGFSQGGALALHVGLRYPEKLGGIMGLSTYLPVADHVAEEKHPANAATPIFLAHGDDDDILPLDFAESAKKHLAALHYAVDWKVYKGMAHSVCMEEIRDIRAWLLEQLETRSEEA